MQGPFFRPALLALLVSTTSFAGAETAAPAPADMTLTLAQQYLDQQQAQAAYELLLPLEDDRGGEPDYDYLLGLSALESGQAGRAAFAFERCLAVDPKHGPCRLQMARTHMALGETLSARRELSTVQEYNPPPEVSAVVSRYLGALAERDAEEQRHIGAYAQLGLGYDSNANSANTTSQIAVAPIGGVVLNLVVNPADRDQADAFMQGAAGADLRYRLSPAWALLADLNVNMRSYQDVDRYNSLAGDLSLGAGYRQGAHQFQGKVQGQSYHLDGESFRNLTGLMGAYQYQLSDAAQLSGYAQASRMSYPGQAFRDADRYTVGGAWSQALAARFRPVLYAGLYGGTEEPRTDNVQFQYLGQDFYGVRGGGVLFLRPALQLNASLSIEHREFKAQYPVAIPSFITRAETQYDASLGLSYMLAPGLSLRPAVSYTQTQSNIIINEYQRGVASLDIRYEH